MIRHFASCNNVPGETEVKPHVYPEYGPSTTDPTFYEPTATRIANMKKSSSAMKGIFDFEGKLEGKTPDEVKANALKQLESGRVDVRYSQNGLTREEISQITTEKTFEVENMLSDKKKAKEDRTNELKKELETAEAVSKVLEKSTKTTIENTSSEN